jgi:hypothetical protein
MCRLSTVVGMAMGRRSQKFHSDHYNATWRARFESSGSQWRFIAYLRDSIAGLPIRKSCQPSDCAIRDSAVSSMHILMKPTGYERRPPKGINGFMRCYPLLEAALVALDWISVLEAR